MKRDYFIKKTMSFVLSMIMMLTSSTVLAQENTNLPDNRNYFLVNGTETVYEGEDYENPETGEYLRWNTDARSVDKEFSFMIRYSLTSSSFDVSDDHMAVTVFSSSIFDSFSKKLSFEVGEPTHIYMFSVDPTLTYKIEIVNHDYLDEYYFLVGYGTIETL